MWPPCRTPLTLDSFADLPAEHTARRCRTITVRRVDRGRRRIALDIVVHGEHGMAGPWAATAKPGEPIYLMGPSGAYTPDPAADWHLLAGDESALPAISAALEALPPARSARSFIEVAGPDDEIPLTAPEGVEVNWIYRGGRADLVPEDRAGDHAPLIEAVNTASGCPGRCTSSSTARPRPSCTTCGPTSAKSAASTRNGRRSRDIGGAGAPKRRSGSGRRSWPRPRPAARSSPA